MSTGKERYSVITEYFTVAL